MNDQKRGPSEAETKEIAEELRTVVAPLISKDSERAEFHGAVTAIGRSNRGVWCITAAHVVHDLVRRFYPHRREHRSSGMFVDEIARYPLRPFINSGQIVLDWDNGEVNRMLTVNIIAYLGKPDIAILHALFPADSKALAAPCLAMDSDSLRAGSQVMMFGYSKPTYEIGSDGRLWQTGPFMLAVSGGKIVACHEKHPWLQIPTYEIEAYSEHGMSGGPVLTSHPKFGSVLSGVISHGTLGCPEPTHAIQAWAFYMLKMRDAAGQLIDFGDLVRKRLIMDIGRDQPYIESIEEPGGIRLRRRSRIVASRPRILVPRGSITK